MRRAVEVGRVVAHRVLEQPARAGGDRVQRDRARVHRVAGAGLDLVVGADDGAAVRVHDGVQAARSLVGPDAGGDHVPREPGCALPRPDDQLPVVTARGVAGAPCRRLLCRGLRDPWGRGRHRHGAAAVPVHAPGLPRGVLAGDEVPSEDAQALVRAVVADVAGAVGVDDDVAHDELLVAGQAHRLPLVVCLRLLGGDGGPRVRGRGRRLLGCRRAGQWGGHRRCDGDTESGACGQSNHGLLLWKGPALGVADLLVAAAPLRRRGVVHRGTWRRADLSGRGPTRSMTLAKTLPNAWEPAVARFRPFLRLLPKPGVKAAVTPRVARAARPSSPWSRALTPWTSARRVTGTLRLVERGQSGQPRRGAVAHGSGATPARPPRGGPMSRRPRPAPARRLSRPPQPGPASRQPPRATPQRRARRHAQAAALDAVDTYTGLTFTVPAGKNDLGQPQTCTIDADLYKPHSASSAARVPAILTTNGFGGSKADQAGLGRAFAQRGYTVLSYTGLGFPDSGCKISLDDPGVDGAAASSLVTFLGGGGSAAYDLRRSSAGVPAGAGHPHRRLHRLDDARHPRPAPRHDRRLLRRPDPVRDCRSGFPRRHPRPAHHVERPALLPGAEQHEPHRGHRRTPAPTRAPRRSAGPGSSSASASPTGSQGAAIDPTRNVGCPNFVLEACQAKATLDTPGLPDRATPTGSPTGCRWRHYLDG